LFVETVSLGVGVCCLMRLLTVVVPPAMQSWPSTGCHTPVQAMHINLAARAFVGAAALADTALVQLPLSFRREAGAGRWGKGLLVEAVWTRVA
jgi:hypothetical protein